MSESVAPPNAPDSERAWDADYSLSAETEAWFLSSAASVLLHLEYPSLATRVLNVAKKRRAVAKQGSPSKPA